MKNKTISLFVVLTMQSAIFAQSLDNEQNNTDSDFIESVKMNFKKLEKNLINSDNNLSQDKIIKLNNDGLTDKTLDSINNIEKEAITKAEAIKLKTITEAEANKANIIAKALKDRTLAEAEAIKITTITKAKAIAIVEHKHAKLKEEKTISDAITKNNTARANAELVFQNETKKIKDRMNTILGIKVEEKNTDKLITGIKVIMPNQTNFTMTKTLSAKENISKLFDIEKISFKIGQHNLTQESINTVHKLARILNEYPEVSIEIAGHTDSDGSQKTNKKISQSRVNTIKEILTSDGIDAKRLIAKGYGESKPLVPNTSRKNKARNRRIEINII